MVADVQFRNQPPEYLTVSPRIVPGDLELRVREVLQDRDHRPNQRLVALSLFVAADRTDAVARMPRQLVHRRGLVGAHSWEIDPVNDGANRIWGNPQTINRPLSDWF